MSNRTLLKLIIQKQKNTVEERAFIGQINETNRQPEISYKE